MKSIFGFVSTYPNHAVYMLCYFFVIVAHEHVVKYNIDSSRTNSYNTWNNLAITYTVFSVVGWFISVSGSKASTDAE